MIHKLKHNNEVLAEISAVGLDYYVWVDLVVFLKKLNTINSGHEKECFARDLQDAITADTILDTEEYTGNEYDKLAEKWAERISQLWDLELELCQIEEDGQVNCCGE